MIIRNELSCPIKMRAQKLGLPMCEDECKQFEKIFTLEVGPTCPHTNNDQLFEPSTRIKVIIAEEVQTF